MFVDAPVKGKVFKKLVRDHGEDGALALYEQSVKHLKAELAGDDRWSFTFAVTPGSQAHNPLWGQTTAIPTMRGNRGNKIVNILVNMMPGNVLIIDAHCPFVTKVDVNEAFEALLDHDVVFGANNVGGFWGMGMKRDPLPLDPFKNIDWRGDSILKKVLSNLRHDRKVKMLSERKVIETKGAVEEFRTLVGADAE